MFKLTDKNTLTMFVYLDICRHEGSVLFVCVDSVCLSQRRDESSCVEPVLNNGSSVLFKDTKQWLCFFCTKTAYAAVSPLSGSKPLQSSKNGATVLTNR